MVSPADLVTSDGSKIKFPFEPIVISAAYAILGKNIIKAKTIVKINALVIFFIKIKQLQYILHPYSLIPRICFDFVTYHFTKLRGAFIPFLSCLFSLFARHINIP